MEAICAFTTQTHSCPSSILSLKKDPVAVCASLPIFLCYGTNQTTNLNPSKMKEIKNIIQ